MDNAKDSANETFLGVLNQEIHVDPFGGNKNGERAYRRLERVSAGIFLLTNHIENDPIKQELRASAMGALRELLAVRAELRNASSQKISQLHATLRNIITLVRLLVVSGYVSPQNAEVVIMAIEDFSAYLSASMKSPLSEPRPLTKDDFLVGTESYKGHIKDKKDRRVEKDTKEMQPSPFNATFGSRAATIIDVLKGNKDLNIKDVAMHLPEFGEKTIQRELTALMAAGIVKRTGLKRWSRYSLNDSETQIAEHTTQKE